MIVYREVIEKRMRHLNLKPSDLARKLNISTSGVNKILREGTTKTRTLINLSEILQVPISSLSPEEIGGSHGENIDFVTDQKIKIAGGHSLKPIPFYDIDIAASNTTMFSDQPEVSNLQIAIPGYEDCSFAVPVWGQSMVPTYDSGSIILCKKISDYDIIQLGEPYLIVTDEQRFVKRILKSGKKETILCASDNYEENRDGQRVYAPFEVEKSKIKQLYIIKGSIRRSQM